MKKTSQLFPGLSKQESNIYLAILRGGKVSQTDIAKATGINRTSLYPILSTLLKKDLIQKVPSGKRIKYKASNPNKLLGHATSSITTLEKQLPALIEMNYPDAEHHSH